MSVAPKAGGDPNCELMVEADGTLSLREPSCEGSSAQERLREGSRSLSLDPGRTAFCKGADLFEGRHCGVPGERC